MDTCISWLKDNGINGIQGPLGFTDLDEEGMLTKGFDQESSFYTIYNYSYYPEFLKKYGFEDDATWVEYLVTAPDEFPERIERIKNVVLKRNKLRLVENLSKKELVKKYANGIFDVLNEAYSPLYGVVELTKKQVDTYVSQYLSFVKTDFIVLLVDENDHVVAFGIAIPNLNRAAKKAKGKLFPFGFIHFLKALNKNDQIDLLIVGILPEYQNKGLNALLMDKMFRSCQENGIVRAHCCPELIDNNKIRSFWENFDHIQNIERKTFFKEV